MQSLRYLLVSIIVLSIMASCHNKDEEKLKSEVSKELTITNADTIKVDDGDIVSQYEDLEFQLNETYIKKLKETPEKTFENELETFEDNELGVIKSYKHMFQYFFLSTDEWNDMYIVLSNKYFNPLDIEKEINNLNRNHIKEIKAVRDRFIRAKFKSLPEIKLKQIPYREVSLAKFRNNIEGNITIEVGTEIFSWLLTMLLGWLLIAILDKVIAHLGCIIDIVVGVIVLIISTILSTQNDNQLMNSLRQQEQKKYQLDEKQTLESLNKNTIEFYDTFK